MPTMGEVLDKIVLADILDDSILAARPGDPSFPLRALMGDLSAKLTGDDAFTLATGLNFFFRAEMDEDVKMRVGFEVSRQYYRFVKEAGFEPQLLAQTSPLLAKLMSTELSRTRLESVDHATVFDSAVHEREEGSNAASAKLLKPASFLCRVIANNLVRAKARVIT